MLGCSRGSGGGWSWRYGRRRGKWYCPERPEQYGCPRRRIHTDRGDCSFVNYPYYISLKVLDIVIIFRTVFVACNRIIFIEKGHAARGSIGIDELTVIVDVAVGCTVDGLGDADAGGIVGVGIRIGSLGDARKPASGFPVKGHAVAVLGGIAYLIIDYTIPVEVSQ